MMTVSLLEDKESKLFKSGEGPKEKKPLPWRTKEHVIPSSHTHSTNPSVKFRKQTGLN